MNYTSQTFKGKSCHFGKEYEGTADYDNAASVWGTRWLLMWNLPGWWAALVSVSGSDFSLLAQTKGTFRLKIGWTTWQSQPDPSIGWQPISGVGMPYCWNGETTKADMFSEFWLFQVPLFLGPTYLALSLRSTRSMDVIYSLPSNILISNCVRQCSSICLKELFHAFLASQNLKQVCIQVLVWNMCTSFFRWFNDIWCVLGF